jgi:integrase
MRPGELLGLRWEDATLSDTGGTLQVNRTLSDGELTTPKTKESRRRIKLSAGSIAALRGHRKRQLEEMMQRAGLWQDNGLVFPSSVGTRLSHRNLVGASRHCSCAPACLHRSASTISGTPALPCCSPATSTLSTCRSF